MSYPSVWWAGGVGWWGVDFESERSDFGDQLNRIRTTTGMALWGPAVAGNNKDRAKQFNTLIGWDADKKQFLSNAPILYDESIEPGNRNIRSQFRNPKLIQVSIQIEFR